ncbi:hypothetical protein A6B39_08390 [Mannheimia granulomatis]|uniref:GtrA family protein n=1 Tax=Mannheimia granulomatis TaxID=85402 RepID=UPI00159D670E|nr:GtrA family protein [Mannheimia granulomatis]QLB15466.1 hypothetical protein A6B39_08390 [Mannheimia granulomatis]
MFGKYLLVGVINTTLTAFIIFLLMWLGFSIYISNAVGYIFGVIVSYILNSNFTFVVEKNTQRFIKFIISCFMCYFINLIAINIALLIYYNEYLAQLVGMGFYTISSFIINKLWVMKNE